MLSSEGHRESLLMTDHPHENVLGWSLCLAFYEGNVTPTASGLQTQVPCYRPFHRASCRKFLFYIHTIFLVFQSPLTHLFLTSPNSEPQQPVPQIWCLSAARMRLWFT